MSVTTSQPLADLQSSHDPRDIAINKVGIRRLRYPLTLLQRGAGPTVTAALVNMYVSLDGSFKGTHMSRFVEVLNEFRDALDINNLRTVLARMKEHLEAADAYLELEFPLFFARPAPVTGQVGLQAYDCAITASLDATDHLRTKSTVVVPVTTLCPCSKEISDYGAHNQRSMVTLQWRSRRPIWLEEMIELVESQASCPVFPLLKRPDEKWVTERAYENPKFVEDMVRDLTAKLREDERLTWYRVESENEESIHAHNCFALVEETPER
ncbi:MAG TPA: GTP cyclohydrolase I FolE2 [Armatimonadetes bacterium]|nr:GTP cyclohydrolase I FolE2 [Armatimonadota bacterium]